MIYVILPNYYFHYNLMSKIFLLNYKYKDALKFPVTFVGAMGNYPFNYWNGSINNITSSSIPLYKNIYDLSIKNGVPFFIDNSNIFLTENNFYDTFNKIILKANENGSNVISLSNLALYQHLKEQYPNYKFMFSNNADLQSEMTPDIINAIVESDNFYLIQVPKYYISNFDIINQITHKAKLIMPLTDPCANCSYDTWGSCKSKEHDLLYNFSKQSILNSCSKRLKYNNPKNILISYDEIQNNYLPLGINHFSLAEFSNNDLMNFIIFFLNYFIKPEHYDTILQYLTEGTNV